AAASISLVAGLDDISRRPKRLRSPVEALFGGIGSCSEMGYQGRGWAVVSVDVDGEECALLFSRLPGYSVRATALDGAHAAARGNSKNTFDRPARRASKRRRERAADVGFPGGQDPHRGRYGSRSGR